MQYRIFAYTAQGKLKMSEEGKESFDNQVIVLVRRMQVDLGIRKYSEGKTKIICPECATKHDAFDKCPKCGMKYDEYMERMRIAAEQELENGES